MKIPKNTPNFYPLSLVVSKKPFDAITSGIKKEEYREIKPYWESRLDGHDYTHVEFRNGYQTYAPRIVCELIRIRKGKPNPDLCFGIIDPSKDVYILELGNIVEVNYQ